MPNTKITSILQNRNSARRSNININQKALSSQPIIHMIILIDSYLKTQAKA